MRGVRQDAAMASEPLVSSTSIEALTPNTLSGRVAAVMGMSGWRGSTSGIGAGGDETSPQQSSMVSPSAQDSGAAARLARSYAPILTPSDHPVSVQRAQSSSPHATTGSSSAAAGMAQGVPSSTRGRSPGPYGWRAHRISGDGSQMSGGSADSAAIADGVTGVRLRSRAARYSDPGAPQLPPVAPSYPLSPTSPSAAGVSFPTTAGQGPVDKATAAAAAGAVAAAAALTARVPQALSTVTASEASSVVGGGSRAMPVPSQASASAPQAGEGSSAIAAAADWSAQQGLRLRGESEAVEVGSPARSSSWIQDLIKAQPISPRFQQVAETPQGSGAGDAVPASAAAAATTVAAGGTGGEEVLASSDQVQTQGSGGIMSGLWSLGEGRLWRRADARIGTSAAAAVAAGAAGPHTSASTGHDAQSPTHAAMAQADAAFMAAAGAGAALTARRAIAGGRGDHHPAADSSAGSSPMAQSTPGEPLSPMLLPPQLAPSPAPPSPAPSRLTESDSGTPVAHDVQEAEWSEGTAYATPAGSEALPSTSYSSIRHSSELMAAMAGAGVVAASAAAGSVTAPGDVAIRLGSAAGGPFSGTHELQLPPRGECEPQVQHSTEQASQQHAGALARSLGALVGEL